VASAVILFAWFPFSSLLQQRSTLSATAAQLSGLRKQDVALAQENKNLSDDAEIGRIAREQYQLVSPGQKAYEVLPPSGSSAARAPFAGDPGSTAPVAPTAASELPPGGVTTTTTATPPASDKGGKTAAQPGSGMLSRMLHALEFWR
jgi:Septum formation initiator